ncbi:MAG: hypothetical protein DLM50_06790 [Candidatus Meridianibacter frigidus]|nr:MAG: hypothetical protein DLM50_06790 [Candidatus Eremiobacteraeota bacterium]
MQERNSQSEPSNCRNGRSPLLLRIASGAVAGFVATVLMDAAGTLFWERAMSPSVQKREREVEPRFPLNVLGERIAQQLGFQSVEATGEQISTILHWGIGLGCGALHGAIAESVRIERQMLGLPIAAGMLAADEFGFPAGGLCPWPAAFPWQTHARAAFAHAVYGITMALFYEGIRAWMAAETEMRGTA